MFRNNRSHANANPSFGSHKTKKTHEIQISEFQIGELVDCDLVNL